MYHNNTACVRARSAQRCAAAAAAMTLKIPSSPLCAKRVTSVIAKYCAYYIYGDKENNFTGYVLPGLLYVEAVLKYNTILRVCLINV